MFDIAKDQNIVELIIQLKVFFFFFFDIFLFFLKIFLIFFWL